MAWFNNEEGRWITTKTGKHVFIKNGQSIKEALGEAFGEEFTYDTDDEFDDGDFRGLDIDWDSMDQDLEPEEVNLKVRKIILQKPSSGGYSHDLKAEFNDMLNYPWQNDKINNMINKQVNDKNKLPNGIKLKDTKTVSRFKQQDRILLDISEGDSIIRIAQKYFHESGHCSDWISVNKFQSSTYVSKKYNKTLSDMLKEEINSVPEDELVNAYYEMDGRRNALWDMYLNDEIHWNEYEERYTCLAKAQTDLADIIQGQKGDDFVLNYFKFIPHSPRNKTSYYNQGNFLAGAEAFAEITCHLATDKRNYFINVMKNFIPKTLEIYNELLEELQ